MIEDLLSWIIVLSVFCKIITHLTIGQTKKRILEYYLFIARLTGLVLWPLKKTLAKRSIVIIGNTCLASIYFSFDHISLDAVGIPAFQL
jgi:preprotein translocase subunit SecE